jgi:hypothetical protein
MKQKVRDSLESFFLEKKIELPELHFSKFTPHVGATKLKRVERSFDMESSD